MLQSFFFFLMVTITLGCDIWCQTMMCNSDSEIGIGMELQEFSGMLELESELN